MTMLFSVAVFIIVSLACFDAVVDSSSTDCPMPSPPENGEFFFYQGGMMVKYSCNPGYKLVGKEFSNCRDSEWSTVAPQCLSVKAVTGDPISYDYTCYQTNEAGRASLITAPNILNAVTPTYYQGRIANSPNDIYLSAVYRCKTGYRMRDPASSTLYCSQRSWHGERPICDHTDCEVNNGGCEQMCSKYPNGIFRTCSCGRGFRLSRDLRSCVRITTTPQSSCSVYNGRCSQICTPDESNGSVKCSCNNGFYLSSDGRTCYDINECSDNNFGCSQNCVNIMGNAYCTCNGGYTLASDGKTCKVRPTSPPNRRTCSFRNGFCNHICNDSTGEVRCSCRAGFKLAADEKRCVDINECSQGNFGCSQDCVNTMGSVRCRCGRGYILSSDGKTCEDVDECADERKHRCHHKCVNTIGSYTCSCLPGYVMLRNTCVGCPKNSYMSESGTCEECPSNSHTVGEGKSTLEDCICDIGYTGNPSQGIPCADIDECEENNFGCSGKCINTPGSAHCFCPEGYELKSDQKTCVDIDECSIKNGGCEITCHNTIGSFYCSCPDGYRSSNVDAYSCIDIDECAEKNHTCSHICNNFPGGYYCSCGDGFRLDSSQKTCTAVTCSQIAVPHYAKLLCGPAKGRRTKIDPATAEFQYGTTCTFKCSLGFKLSILPGMITCGEDGSWIGEKPNCVPLNCPPIQVPLNGDVAPASCATQGGDVLQKCYVTCSSGFQLKGYPVFTCKRNLTWQPEEFPECQPVKVLPHVSCLPDVNTELAVGTNSTEIDILPPTSNMDPEYISTSPAWVKLGKVIFPAGTTDITYTAISPTAPNTVSSCTRTIKVIDKEPPRAIYCPESISFDSSADSDEDSMISWKEPRFEDNVGVISIKKTLEPNVSLSPGVHFVEYVAKDAEGNVAECVFHINVTDVGCKDPTGPENGYPNCDDWMFGRICEPTCAPGYTFYSTEPSFYTCDSSGTWYPSNVIENCIKFITSDNFQCPDGMELRIDGETEEEICVECPSSMVWSNSTKSCVDAVSSPEDEDYKYVPLPPLD